MRAALRSLTTLAGGSFSKAAGRGYFGTLNGAGLADYFWPASRPFESLLPMRRIDSPLPYQNLNLKLVLIFPYQFGGA